MDPGPSDPSVLHLQSTHRSTEIWRVGGGDVQRCRRRNPNQTRLPPIHTRMIPLLQATGFYGIARVASLHLDWGIITALVERWRPETHTFHLPMGECTITLQDVAVLLGLRIDGEAVIGVIQEPGMSWPDIVASVFGHSPPSARFNGARLQLSWFETFIPPQLDDDASDKELRRYTRFYLLQLIAGSMFTDHSGGLVHCMWISYLRDLDVLGRYAWGAAVLAFLYRELCKGCKIDREEVAGCLILLQLWAWERLPTIAPVRTTHSLVDEQLWAGQLAAPLGVRWLVRHSFSEKSGRTVSVYRAILDDLAPSHFIWQLYTSNVIETLPKYCFIGQHIWRYRGPLICIFIVEPHMSDRVMRQFGMVQSIPDDAVYSSDQHRLTLKGNLGVSWVQKHQPSIDIWNSRLDHIFESQLIVSDGTVPEYRDWYVVRTRRFHSRMGALHAYIGDLLKKIAERTHSVLPDVSDLATDGYHHIQEHSHCGLFEVFPLEERREKEIEARQVTGRRPKRGGHRGGRTGARSLHRRVDGEFLNQVVPTLEDNDPYEAHLGDDHDPIIKEADTVVEDVDPMVNEADTVVKEADPIVNEAEPEVDVHQPNCHIPEDVRHMLSSASFDIFTPSAEGDSVQPIQGVHEKTKHPTDEYPTFNIGITSSGSLLPTQPPVEEELSQSQSTQSSQNPLTQVVNEPSIVLNSTHFDGVESFKYVYEPRRLKRVHKSTKYGTGGHKLAKHH